MSAENKNAHLPCGCVVTTAPGQLGRCERQPQCLGDPR